jgi:hypothetical protein
LLITHDDDDDDDDDDAPSAPASDVRSALPITVVNQAFTWRRETCEKRLFF